MKEKQGGDELSSGLKARYNTARVKALVNTIFLPISRTEGPT